MKKILGIFSVFVIAFTLVAGANAFKSWNEEQSAMYKEAYDVLEYDFRKKMDMAVRANDQPRAAYFRYQLSIIDKIIAEMNGPANVLQEYKKSH